MIVVTLPAGTFTAPPTVMLNGFHGWIITAARHVTASSFKIHAWTVPGKRVNAGTVDWLAVGE